MPYRGAGPIRKRWPPPPANRRRPGATWPADQSHRPAADRRASQPEAEAEYRKAMAIGQKLADDNPAVTGFRSDLANSHNNLGILLSDTGKPSEAEAEFRKAIAIVAEAGRRQPRRHRIPQHLANNHDNLGFLLSGMGKPSEAGTELRKAIAVHQKLADDNPAVIEFRKGLANNHNSLACATVGDRQADGGGGRVPRGDRDHGEGRRRRPQGLGAPGIPRRISPEPRPSAPQARPTSRGP